MGPNNPDSFGIEVESICLMTKAGSVAEIFTWEYSHFKIKQLFNWSFKLTNVLNGFQFSIKQGQYCESV